MSTTTTICLWVLTFTACLLTVVKTNSLPIRETPSQLRFVKQPNNIHVDQNGRVRLRCRFHGLEPHHIVTWTKNNDTISESENNDVQSFVHEADMVTIKKGTRKKLFGNVK